MNELNIIIDRRGLSVENAYEEKTNKTYSTEISQNIAYYIDKGMEKAGSVEKYCKQASKALFEIMTSYNGVKSYKNLGKEINGEFYERKWDQARFVAESIDKLEKLQDKCKLPEEDILRTEMAILARFDFITGLPNEESSLNCPWIICTEKLALTGRVLLAKLITGAATIFMIFHHLFSIDCGSKLVDNIKQEEKTIEMDSNQKINQENKLDSFTSWFFNILKMIVVVSETIFVSIPASKYFDWICNT